MAGFSSWLSLYGACKKTGHLIDFTNNPLLADITIEDIVWVKLCNIGTLQGGIAPAFQLMCNNDGGLTYFDVYLYTYTGFTTMAQFLDGLATLSGSTDTALRFNIYTNLLSIDYKKQNTTGQSVILNNGWVVPGGRRYVPQTNSTFVDVKVNTKLTKTKWEFSGNQTFGGLYHYFYT